MSDSQSILFLSEKDLAGLGIATAEVVASIEALFYGRADNKVWSAPKAVILPGDGRYMMAALAAADEPALLAVKTVVLNPDNPKCGLPQINGLITMLDSASGLPLVVMDGNWVTAVRTAGLSAVAAKHMARPNSEVVAFIGCGVQAQSHLQAFSDMFPLKAVKIFGRGRPNIEALGKAAADLGLAVEVCDSGPAAIAEADLVVTSITYSAGFTPFLDAREMKSGAFAAGTDLGIPWIPEGLQGFDRIAIDDLAQEAAMTDKLADPALVTGDLEGLVLGKYSGRENDAERTAFIFRAHALGDLALSALAYGKARDKGQGVTVPT